MLKDLRLALCWWCGRYASEVPPHWYAPFLIERAHIVNKPRVEDRRVVVLLCSQCHYAQHNSNVFGYGLPVVTVAHMLWLKRVFDREFYDREFMQRYSVGRLPNCLVPPEKVMIAFAARHGGYPRG